MFAQEGKVNAASLMDFFFLRRSFIAQRHLSFHNKPFSSNNDEDHKIRINIGNNLQKITNFIIDFFSVL
jgi:hypothetical protein